MRLLWRSDDAMTLKAFATQTASPHATATVSTLPVQRPILDARLAAPTSVERGDVEGCIGSATLNSPLKHVKN